MKTDAQKQHQASGTDQGKGQREERGGGRLEAAAPQPKDTPSKTPPESPAEEEQRSDLADVGEADEQQGTVDGMKSGSRHQDPPATLPQEQRHEKRNNV